MNGERFELVESAGKSCGSGPEPPRRTLPLLSDGSGLKGEQNAKKAMKTPMSTAPKVKYVGLDVHAETVAVAIAENEARVYGTVSAHTHALAVSSQRFIR